MTRSSYRVSRLARMRRHRRTRQKGKAAPWVFGLLSLPLGILGLVVVAVLGVILSMAGTYVYYARQLPPPAQIALVQSQNAQTTLIYDRSGQVTLYEVIPPTEGDRKRISVYDMPPHFREATIAIEDASFYSNPGFDLRGISRALWTNFLGGELQGGSSITQQLVKNTLLAQEERLDVSVDRKIKEIILASEISRLYSKDQILEWYINTNFYGNLAYGVEAAAQVYFGKSARDLTLAESAVLAAIPQFPAQNPLDNPEAARLRQELVLRRMLNLGYISQTEYEAALAEQIVISPFQDRLEILAPHFSLYARAEAEALLNQQGLDGAYLISEGGLRIYTTLDFNLQEQLECVARSHVARLASNSPGQILNTSSGSYCNAADYLPPYPESLLGTPRTVTNAAGVVIRAETGEIVAMLGSVDFWDTAIDGNFNVAIAERQPGSTFKPFVYLTAFLTPLDPSTIVTPGTMLSDVYLEFSEGQTEPYVPLNLDRQYHGPVSVREALANSYNVPTVQVLNWVGLSPVIRTAHRLGINSLNQPLSNYGLALGLGTGEVNLLDLTYAYNVFNTLGYGVGTPVHSSQAREGYRQLNPTSILRIEDSSGQILWQYSPEAGTFDRRLIIPPGMAYIMTDLLADEEARLPAFGRDNPLELSRRAAAKTGTTDDNRDSWTVGYTPYYTTGVWVGNNDNRSMGDITGMTGAAPIWHAIMEYLHARDALPPRTWERPSTVVEQTVCLWSGLLPTQNCPQVPNELFYVDPINGVDYRPQGADDMWYRLRVDVCNNTRANDTTPPQCVEERIFFDFPPEFADWALANTPDLVAPQAEGFVSEGSSQFSPLAIVSPRFPDQVSGVVEIRGNTNQENLLYFQIGYGVGNEPSTFIQIGENGSQAGFNQALGLWDTSNLPDGVYTLRLQVVDGENRAQNTSTRVTVDNTPPQIRLLSPLTAASYSAAADVVVALEAELFDAGDIERVEFYIDRLETSPGAEEGEIIAPAEGVLLGEAAAFPYSLSWGITEQGLRTFWAVTYDRAGNRSESERVIIRLEP
jgi:membrane peptidoglycan carboxypeptidase